MMKARMSDAADKKFVELAKNGDFEAFGELVRRYRERIYQTIFRFTRNHGDTDDLTQETFMLAFKAIGRFQQKSEFYTWIFRIAVNQSLNFLKKKKREMAKEVYKEKRLDKQLLGYSSPESASLSKELEERLHDAVESLPPPYKSSFVLVVFQAMTHGEAARVLGCSENTVSWRMHKARKMLQNKLRPYLDEVRNEMPKI
jgi:RNA polymerase sigma-70 factor, ECF subfamily